MVIFLKGTYWYLLFWVLKINQYYCKAFLKIKALQFISLFGNCSSKILKKKQWGLLRCIYCKDGTIYHQNMRKHLQRHHQHEIDVASLPRLNKADRAKVMRAIRSVGNDLHNAAVIANGSGNIIVSRLCSQVKPLCFFYENQILFLLSET